MPKRLNTRISNLVTCLAAGAFAATLLAAPASAQGVRKGHVLHHDSSNPPPGHVHGKGKGHDKPAGSAPRHSG